MSNLFLRTRCVVFIWNTFKYLISTLLILDVSGSPDAGWQRSFWIETATRTPKHCGGVSTGDNRALQIGHPGRQRQLLGPWRPGERDPWPREGPHDRAPGVVPVGPCHTQDHQHQRNEPRHHQQPCQREDRTWPQEGLLQHTAAQGPEWARNELPSQFLKSTGSNSILLIFSLF